MRLKLLSTQKTFLLAVLLLFCCGAFAQDYQKITFRVDSFANVGLPKSALAEVKKLNQLARKNKNVPMQIKAVIYRMTFQSYLEENALTAIIDSLKADVNTATYPAKPVLQSMLANMYYQYYQQNRYRYNQRTQVTNAGTDYTQWDLRTIIDETSRLYKLSLADATQQQATSIEVLDGVLSGDKSLRYLRPTLYDMLVQRALSFFLGDEPELIRPSNPFTLNNPVFFSDAQTFVKLPVTTADTASNWYKGIKYLQQASAFHLQQGNSEALADLDLQRLQFLYSHVTIENKDTLYTEFLRQIANTFSDKPISTDALVLLGNYYKQKDSLKTAIAIFKQAAAKFPLSKGSKNAVLLINDMQTKTIAGRVEHENLPGKTLLLSISYRNIEEAKYAVYRLNANEVANLVPKQYEYQQTSKKLLALIKGKTPVQQKQFLLNADKDYLTHETEYKVEPLTTGSYILAVAEAGSADSLVQLTGFNVTRLAYVSRLNPNDDVEVRVTDRETGAPLAGVTVKLINRILVNNRTGRATFKDTVLTGFTNKSGSFIAKNHGRGNDRAELRFKDDIFYTTETNIYGNIYDDDEEDAEDKTVLFTDRQIYRPGQTIYFKGLQLQVIKGKNKIMPFKEVEVNFNDVNYKKVTSLKLKTNEFGTFAGQFTIPQTMLNGDVTIETDDGNIRVKVEEYKRPTFKAEFMPVTKTYRPDDSVTVKGNVTAFSGYGLSNVKVAYHITRQTSQIDYRYGNRSYINIANAEIKTDTIISNSQGVFTIKFKAIPAEVKNRRYIVFQYNITADVTDAAGETRTAATVVGVGYTNLQIINEVPDKLPAQNAGKVAVAIRNLNAQPQNGNIRMRIYALKNPGITYKNRLWSPPDKLLMSRETYRANFAGYVYGKEDDSKTWPEVKQVTDVTVKVDSSQAAFVDLKALKDESPGIYKVVLSAQNQQGDTTSVTKYVDVVAEKASPANFNNWVVPVLTSVQAGQTALFLVGIDKPCTVLMEKYKGPTLISSEWLTLGAGQQKIEVKTAAGDSDMSVQFMMVHQNRQYSSYQHIDFIKPDNSIVIKLLSFKDKLQPGEKDQWKLQLSAGKNEKLAAEMVASLYDASLDDLTPTEPWQNIVNPPRRYNYGGYYSWGGVYNFINPATTQPLFYKYTSFALLENHYEGLNLFGYSYYGGYNSGYRNYLELIKQKASMAAYDKRLEESYKSMSAKVKDGFEISGKVVDEWDRSNLTGVTVMVKGTQLAVTTNSDGYFRLRVPKGGILTTSFIGYAAYQYAVTKNEQLVIALNPANNALNEVAIVGYGTQKRMSITGAVATVQTSLQGKVAGINMRELSSAPGTRFKLNGKEFAGGNANDALKNLPADMMESAQVFNDYGDQASKAGPKPIVIRKNFAETAFFYPQLHTDSKGEILIDFTIPEALTKWRFKGFAHTKELNMGYIEREIVTQKQLSISANTPRLLREGDTLTVSARLANLSDAQLKGTIELQLFNALDMQPVKLLVKQADAKQDFDIASATTKAVSFKMIIPAGLDAVTYRLTADAGKFSDGEENTLPVLPNRMLVTESMPMMVRAGEQKTFTFDKLLNQTSATLKNKTLTLEFTQNPAWYAVQALPYMMEFPYECSEQIFSRYYANSLGTNLVNKMPVIKSVFDRWKAINSTTLLSNLEKNRELKAVLIEETPWLRDATNETEQKQRIALLFDLNKMNYELQQNLEKLEQKQLPDGGFPWFAGIYTDRYITQHILEGIGQLYSLGIADAKDTKLRAIANKAIGYLDHVLWQAELDRKKAKVTMPQNLSATDIHAYYAKSYFAKPVNTDAKTLLAAYLKLAATQWTSHSVYEQGMIALTMQRNDRGDVAKAIIKSLKETAQQSADLGMYWANNRLGYYWYESPVETQSLMIELFTLLPGNEKEVEEMKIWLLRNKQTSNWKTTKATAAAVYALLLKGKDLLADNGTAIIKINNTDLLTLKPNTKADVGTGYIKTSWADEQVKPDLGKVAITNNTKTINWGALHWQYLENLDKITSSATDITLARKYFIQQQGTAGAVLIAVNATHTPKTGDVLKVVVYLKTGRDMEYIHLKDMRPAGTEPVDVLSTYKYQDGLYYYQVTKDVATNFFISQIKKGNYVFEYSLRVAQPGNFSTGISTVQSMYAPEFNAHSEGSRITLNDK